MSIRILGITGTFQSGKDALAAAIGWKKFSCSAIIGEELVRMGLSIDVNQNFVDVGNDLRRLHNDAGILGKKVLERILAEKLGRVIVVSIRTPAELFALKNAKDVDFKLLVLDAPIELRFQRSKVTPRWTNIPFDEFKRQEDLQLSGAEEHSQQLGKVFEFADAKIINDFSSVDDLKIAVDKVLKNWGWL